ncbi:hypothetical protein [Paraburkholderia sp. SIMBA_054]|uniref:hypothetical protein n=1 Tax=Paraburkholderia sp. SIMBA_054 TaxID=3085795 RepID=UPI00397C4264
MLHLARALTPRSLVRRLALGRWDYSTAHILELGFVQSFTGRKFVLTRAPTFFWNRREWTLSAVQAGGNVTTVDITAARGELLATVFVGEIGAGARDRRVQSLRVPDESLLEERQSGWRAAEMILLRIADQPM